MTTELYLFILARAKRMSLPLLLSSPRSLCFCLYAFVCQQDDSKRCRRSLMIFWRIGCATSNKRLDLSGSPNCDADTWIFKGFFSIAERILLITQEVVNELSCNFWEVRCFASNKPYDPSSDPDHEQNPGFLTDCGIVLILWDQWPWRRFAVFECC